MQRRLMSVVAALAALALVAGCGSTGGSGSVTLHVFAASSLQESFTTLARQFEKDHAGTKVVLDFGPSSGLAQQIGQGAPADVFASASTSTMDQVSARTGSPSDFATNRMAIAVPPANPGHVTRLADLARPGVKVAVCQAAVPCGAVASQVLAHAKLHLTPVTEEVDVKGVLTKVELGEVDAGIVYVTDVRAAGDKVRGVPIPDDVNATTTYPIATVKDSRHADLAGAFVRLVESARGQQVLGDAGFAKP